MPTITINWEYFMAAVAVGALAEIITTEYPNTFRRGVSIGKVLLIALAIGAIGNYWAVVGLVIARIGDVLGKYAYFGVVRAAIGVDKWLQDRKRRGESSETLTTETSRISPEQSEHLAE